MGLFAAAIAISTVAKIANDVNTASKQKQNLKLQNQALENDRQQAIELARFREAQAARDFSRLMSSQKLSALSSGAKLEGSVLDILERTEKDKEETIENIRRGLSREEANINLQSRRIRAQRKDITTSSILGSIAGLGQGIAQFRGGS